MTSGQSHTRKTRRIAILATVVLAGLAAASTRSLAEAESSDGGALEAEIARLTVAADALAAERKWWLERITTMLRWAHLQLCREDGEIRAPCKERLRPEVRLVDRDHPSAYESRGRLYFTNDLMRLARNDDELAIVVGHELSHAILDRWWRQATEEDADRLGLELAARAGFDISAAPGFLRRIITHHPIALVDASISHPPTSPARIVAIAAAIDSIEARSGDAERGASARPPPPDRAAVEAESLALGDASRDLYLDGVERAMRVARPILLENVDRCAAGTSPYVGLHLVRVSGHQTNPWRKAWERFGVGSLPTIVALDPKSPAANAGLRIHDRLKAVRGHEVSKVSEALERWRDDASAPLRIDAVRGGGTRGFEIQERLACSAFVDVTLDRSIATRTIEGFGIAITMGQLDFVQSDDELALLIARGLAHQLDTRARDQSCEREIEADRIAFALAARAGYDVGQAARLWERIAIESPDRIPCSGTSRHEHQTLHGGLAARLLAMPRSLRAISPRGRAERTRP